MTATVRRTQQQRRDQAETALLNAAAELVVEEGVHSLTLARVGERARYSRGLVTHYFGSKQALLQRLAHATQTGFVPGLGGLPAGIDRLLRLIDGYIGSLGQLKMMNRAFLLLWAEAARNLPRVDLVAAGYRRHVRLEPEELRRLPAMMCARPVVLAVWNYCLGRASPAAAARTVTEARDIAAAAGSRAAAALGG